MVMGRTRIWFTAAQKAELWERWKNGQSSCRPLGESWTSRHRRLIFRWCRMGGSGRRRGGVPDWQTLWGREEILRGIAGGRSMRPIAGAGTGAVDGKPGDQAQWRSGIDTGLRGRGDACRRPSSDRL